jgi:hypothetical protein
MRKYINNMTSHHLALLITSLWKGIESAYSIFKSVAKTYLLKVNGFYPKICGFPIFNSIRKIIKIR